MKKLSLVSRFSLVFLTIVLILPGDLYGFWQPALAAAPTTSHTYVVNSTLDTPNPDPTTGICADAQGRCTLRAAIQLVNYVKGTDTITLPAGIYKLTRPGYDDAALVGDLDIGVDLTIQGAGSGVTIVDGNGVVTGDRVFQILSTAKFTTLLTTLSPETEYLCVLPMMLLRWGRFQKTKRISIPIIQCFGVSTDGIYNTAGEWFGQKGSSWVY